MEKEIYLTILFDYYGELLTEKQQTYFKNYYFDNLSLAEISENLNVSRNAIHKELKYISEKLEFYEEHLKIYEKDKKLEALIEKITDESIKEELISIKDN